MPGREDKLHFGLYDATAGGFATVVAGATGADGTLTAGTEVVELNYLLPLHGVDSMVDKGSAAEAGGTMMCCYYVATRSIRD